MEVVINQESTELKFILLAAVNLYGYDSQVVSEFLK